MSEMEAEKRAQLMRAPPPFPPPSCPRCSSGNTKFCYYNNYSTAQPRYFCKDCRRYWTHGGVVRSIPSRKRGKLDAPTSSCAQFSRPPSSGLLTPPPPSEPTWIMRSADHNPGGLYGGSSVGHGAHGTYGPPITENYIQSFGGGGFSNQEPNFNYNQGGELLDCVNNAFGAVNLGFGGGSGSNPPPAPPNPMWPQLTQSDTFYDYNVPVVNQGPEFQQPPVAWTGQNLALINSNNTTLSAGPNNFLSMARARDPNAGANVVSINDWPELNDMDYGNDPFHGYKPPSP